jgi:hypothetical protein
VVYEGLKKISDIGLGLYEGFPIIADLGFLISEIKENTFALQNKKDYTSEIQHPISPINGF